jgi:hypothetical protein
VSTDLTLTSTLPHLVDLDGDVDLDTHVDQGSGGVRTLDEIEIDEPWFDAFDDRGGAA